MTKFDAWWDIYEMQEQIDDSVMQDYFWNYLYEIAKSDDILHKLALHNLYDDDKKNYYMEKYKFSVYLFDGRMPYIEDIFSYVKDMPTNKDLLPIIFGKYEIVYTQDELKEEIRNVIKLYNKIHNKNVTEEEVIKFYVENNLV
jgi:hypothetical protein